MMSNFDNARFLFRPVRLLFLVVFLAVAGAAPVWAQQVAPAAPVAKAETTGDSQTARAGLMPREPGEASTLSQQISKEIYSPFCPGKTLEMCPSGGASEVRQQIQALAREGVAKQEIIDTVIADIGEKYRIIEPPPEDNYMLLGLLIGAFLLCVAVIYFVGRRVRAKGGWGGEESGSREDELSAEDRLYLEELRGEYLD